VFVCLFVFRVVFFCVCLPSLKFCHCVEMFHCVVMCQSILMCHSVKMCPCDQVCVK
jgi:hypothetical protein